MFKANGFINPGANNLFAVGVYNRKMMGGIWKPVHIVACEAELDLQALREVLKK